MYYSKFEQEPSAFIKVLTKWSLTRTQTQWKKALCRNSKSGRGLLRELFSSEFKRQVKWGFTMPVVTRDGRFREWPQEEL